MKKVLLVSLAAALIILSVGCAKQTEAPKGEIKVEDSQPKQNSEPAKSTEAPKPVVKNTYTNTKEGFSIDFPKSWSGNYIVDDKGTVRVAFVGKSKRGQGYIGNEKVVNGLTMFYIGTKEDVEHFDSIKKIGTVKGVDYYYATPTDYPLGAVRITPGEPVDDITDKKEWELMKVDDEKAMKMQEEVDNILKTFRAN